MYQLDDLEGQKVISEFLDRKLGNYCDDWYKVKSICRGNQEDNDYNVVIEIFNNINITIYFTFEIDNDDPDLEDSLRYSFNPEYSEWEDPDGILSTFWEEMFLNLLGKIKE